MIVKTHHLEDNSASVFHLLFTCAGSIVPAIAIRVLFAAAVGVAAVFVHKEDTGHDFTEFGLGPFTALGVAVSLFLGFRNNACYDRWWEGRKQWGKQVIYVRNFGRLLKATNDSDLLHDALTLVLAQTYALRAQIRPSTAAIQSRDSFLTIDQQDQVSKMANPADGLLRLATDRIAESFQFGRVDSIIVVSLTQQLDKLGEVQGACERIFSTPLPLPYTLLVQRTVFLYILLVPFAMVAESGWYTPLFNAILAYTFFGLDELSRQLEKPFANFPQCLAINAISRLIEISVCEALGKEPPEPLMPINGILM